MEETVYTEIFQHCRGLLWDENLKRLRDDRQYRPLGYERVYLPLCKVADTPFHIQDLDPLAVVVPVI